jgi:hypothetical protein
MVRDINTTSELAKRIQELEIIEARQLSVIKIQAGELFNSLRPAALLKNTLSEVVSSEKIRNSALNASIGLGAGWLIKKILTPKSKNIAKHGGIFKSIAGRVLQIAVTTLISKKLTNLR